MNRSLMPRKRFLNIVTKQFFLTARYFFLTEKKCLQGKNSCVNKKILRQEKNAASKKVL